MALTVAKRHTHPRDWGKMPHMAPWPGTLKAPRAVAQYVGVPEMATVIGVHPNRIREWLRRGILAGVRTLDPHYTDDRPRKSNRGVWRVHRSEWRRFLEMYRAGAV